MIVIRGEGLVGQQSRREETLSLKNRDLMTLVLSLSITDVFKWTETRSHSTSEDKLSVVKPSQKLRWWCDLN